MSVIYPDGSLAEPRFTDDWETYPGHKGVDYVDFDLNRAVDDGTVIFAGYNPSGAGNEVRVQHASGYVTRYLHNASILVSVGQTITKGQSLGIQGATGDATGKHLHFEVRDTNYDPTPPRPWLRARLGSLAGSGSVPFPNTSSRRKKATMLLFDIPNPDKATVAKYPRQFVLLFPNGAETQFTAAEPTFLSALAGQTGSSIPSDRAFIDTIKARLIASLPKTAIGTVEAKPDAALLEATKALLPALVTVGKKIDALPAEIDAYSDGRK